MLNLKQSTRTELPSIVQQKFLTHKMLILDEISSGSFGEIYLIYHTSEREYFAAKILKNSDPSQHIKLEKEYKIMQSIQRFGLFPKVGFIPSQHSLLMVPVLIMELLGPSLEDLLRLCQMRLEVQTVKLLMTQMIQRLHELHLCGYVHSDIKPSNFCIGGDDMRDVFLIDFGLATRFRSKDGSFLKMSTDHKFTGTPRFSSINSHAGYRQSIRDDLESLGYVAVYLTNGILPWMNIIDSNPESKNRKLHSAKLSTSTFKLCTGLPSQFIIYLNYVKSLKFDEVPDYDYLITMFRESSHSKRRYCWESLNRFKNAKKEVGIDESSDFSSFFDTQKSKIYLPSSYLNSANLDDNKYNENLGEEISEEGEIQYVASQLYQTPGMIALSSILFNKC